MTRSSKTVTKYFLLTPLLSYILSVGVIAIQIGPGRIFGTARLLPLLLAGSFFIHGLYAPSFLSIFFNVLEEVRQDLIVQSLSFLFLPLVCFAILISQVSVQSSDFALFSSTGISFIVTACFMQFRFRRTTRNWD